MGDFDGNGVPDLATYLNGVFEINFGHLVGGVPTWSGNIDATLNMGFAGAGGIPVAADMNGDGITDLGVYEPRTSGVNTPTQTSEWYWLVSSVAPGVAAPPPFTLSALNHPFSPTPVGNDIFAQFGDQTALPIVGNFDPPVADQVSGAATAVGSVLGTANVSGQSIQGTAMYSFSPLRSGTMTVSASGTSAISGVSLYDANMDLLGSGSTQVSSAVTAGTQYFAKVTGNSAAVDVNFSNHINQQALLDANQDGVLSPLDALDIINNLNSHGTHAVALTQGNPDIYLDTNLDGNITPIDALNVINALNAAAPAVKGASPTVISTALAATPSAAATSSVASPAIATAGGFTDGRRIVGFHPGNRRSFRGSGFEQRTGVGN